jgi:hypothetical protein
MPKLAAASSDGATAGAPETAAARRGPTGTNRPPLVATTRSCITASAADGATRLAE